MTPATYFPPNLGDLTTPPTRYHKCGPGGSYTFLLSLNPRLTITNPGSVTTSTSNDHNTLTRSSAASRTDYTIEVDRLLPPEASQKEVTITVANEAVLSAPVDGQSIGQATGSTTVIARSADGEVSAKTATVEIAASKTVSFVTGPTNDSLTKHCNDQIENLVSGKGRSSMDLWSVRNNATGSYAWSENCWGAGIDNITCMSPYNTATGNGGGGALITPRHALFCHHLSYYPKVGSQIRYVTPGNVTETFTVEAVEVHPLTAGYIIAWHDIVICKLNRDVPAGIKFAKVLPPDPEPYFPLLPRTANGLGDPAALRYETGGSTPYVRSCHTTQNKRLATSFLRVLPNVVPQYVPTGGEAAGTLFSQVTHAVDSTGYQVARYPGGNPLGDPIVTGDSGAPAFLLVNNELVLLNVWSTVGGGFQLYADATTVNGMLDELGGGYNLTEVDLSGFPTW